MLRASSITLLLCGLHVLGGSNPLLAQNPCEGDGVGSAYITMTPAIVGGGAVINMGSPAAANSVGLLLFGNDGAPSIPFCLGTNQLFVSLLGVLDGTGNATFNLNVVPAAFDSRVYAKPLIWEWNQWSLGKTVRVQTEYSDSHRELATMNGARSLHTCTSLSQSPADNVTGAFVAGGATGNLITPTALDTIEVFDSVTRTWSAGPQMSEPRCRQAVVDLQDGTYLIAGGMTNAVSGTGGPATNSVDLYVPSGNTIIPFPSMTWGRMGHGMTRLNDGRILVTGGFGDWTNAGGQNGVNFVARLDTAQDSTEIYDPATGTWSAGPTMSSKRGGHCHTLLNDGRVLITGGVDGGAQILASGFQYIYVPTFTNTCEIFDPVTNTLTAAPILALARGFHGASLLPNGDVLITGGAASIGQYGDAVATNTCAVWNAATGWAPAAPLPTGVAFHDQVRDHASGDAIIMGGFLGGFTNLQGTTQVVRHDGAAVTLQSTLGTHPALTQMDFATGTAAAAQLHDGTILMTGGFEWAGLTGAPSSRTMLFVQ